MTTTVPDMVVYAVAMTTCIVEGARKYPPSHGHPDSGKPFLIHASKFSPTNMKLVPGQGVTLDQVIEYKKQHRAANPNLYRSDLDWPGGRRPEWRPEEDEAEEPTIPADFIKQLNEKAKAGEALPEELNAPPAPKQIPGQPPLPKAGKWGKKKTMPGAGPGPQVNRDVI